MANHADFTPVMKGYTGQGAFRFWCQKVLPLVYDDSLSYYELLNKVVVYLNNTIADVANVEDNVTALHEAYVALQNFVNDYVDTLDFPAEVNRRLDEMAANGTLTELMLPFIPTIIGAWLEENITPTSPPLDRSFLVPNAAAESDAVGIMFDKAMVSRTQIQDGEDLDDYYEKSGMYYCSRATSTTIDNAPWVDSPFVLCVRGAVTNPSAAGQVQYAFNHAGGFAYRFRYTNSWGDWFYATTTKDEALIMMTRGAISDGEDLDSFYDKSGMYYVNINVAQTVDNTPWNNKKYVLFVKASTDPNARTGQAQFAFTDDGAFAFRLRYLDRWSSWTHIGETADDFKFMYTRGTIPATANLDNYYNQSGMWYCNRDNAGTAFNTPWNDAPFSLFVKSASTEDAGSGQAQYAFSFGGGFAWRFRYLESWGAWRYALTSEDDRLIVKTRGSVEANTDIDSLYRYSGFYYVTSTVAEAANGSPWSNIGYMLLTKCTTAAESQSGQCQMAISTRGDFAVRARFVGEWTPWYYIATKNETTFFDLSIFESIGIIGASYDTGASFDAERTTTVYEWKNAWLNILSRRFGFTPGVYAYPGATTERWLDPTWTGADHCITLFESDDPCELYLVGLGGNDTVTGSIEDCAAFDADPTSTPTTFYGNYAKILYLINQKAPTCRIILCYPPSANIRGDLTEAKEAIKEIAEYYELPLLDLLQNGTWRRYAKSYCSTRPGHNYHPTPLGHAMLAQVYNEMISSTFINYPQYFYTWRNFTEETP